ncbi:hypothetical protein [Hanstruepera marina]|uniref:hypothetical protein n=1 Tax=Hanstruepera marina TaxID=2873265 RepID=UPI001CA6C9BA|nr:hypothetical protein [Hanstruepera marina]
MRDSKYYTCKFCFEQFVPTRRVVQKYCSNSCRSKAYHHRKKNQDQTQQENGLLQNATKELKFDTTDTVVSTKPTKIKVEKLSAAGVGNATLGSLAADGLKALVTKEADKALTKGDIRKIVAEIKGRYHLVLNADPLPDGRKPYFDMETSQVVYRFYWSK